VGQKHLLPRPHRSSPIHDASVAFPKMERNEIKRIWLTSADIHVGHAGLAVE
jgi:hypothetical protein